MTPQKKIKQNKQAPSNKKRDANKFTNKNQATAFPMLYYSDL